MFLKCILNKAANIFLIGLRFLTRSLPFLTNMIKVLYKGFNDVVFEYYTKMTRIINRIQRLNQLSACFFFQNKPYKIIPFIKRKGK